MEKGYLFVVIAGVLYGIQMFGGQLFIDAGLSLYELSLLMMVFAFIFLIPLLIIKKEKFSKAMVGSLIGFGFLGVAGILTQFGGLVLGAPVALVVLLLYTEPFWTIIFGKWLLKEEINRNKVVALLLVLVGVVVLVNPFGGENAGDIPGSMVALLGGIVLSGWVIYTRKADVKKYHYAPTYFGYAFFTSLFLLVSYPIMSLFIQDDSILALSFNLTAEVWVCMGIFVILCVLIPYALFFKGLKDVPASKAGIILLLEPITAAVLATIILQQPVTLNLILGGALILISNYLIVHKGKHHYTVNRKVLSHKQVN